MVANSAMDAKEFSRVEHVERVDWWKKVERFMEESRKVYGWLVRDGNAAVGCSSMWAWRGMASSKQRKLGPICHCFSTFLWVSWMLNGAPEYPGAVTSILAGSLGYAQLCGQQIIFASPLVVKMTIWYNSYVTQTRGSIERRKWKLRQKATRHW